MNRGNGGMLARSLEIVSLRSALWLGFFGAIIVSWWQVYLMASGQGSWFCGPDQVLMLPYLGLAALIPMWAVMMLAMMLPTLWPTLSTYDTLAVSSSSGWAGLVLGYGAVWAVGSVIFALLQMLAMQSGLLSVTGIAESRWTAAGLLALAGGWQFTRGKEICQDACLSPMQYFLGRFRPGFSGGLAMGAEIGLTCIGCCWAIMGLAFIGGMTSLVWMGIATVFMVAEKLPQIGQPLRKPAGFVLLAAAIWVAAAGLPVLT